MATMNLLLGSSGPTIPSTHLIHFDGTNGSTSFTDVGSNAVTVTAGGTGAVETAQAKFGTGALGCGAGAGWASLAHSADQEFGTGDFTIDCWAYLASGGGTNNCIFSKMLNSATVGAWHVKTDASGNMYLLASSSTSSWDYILTAGSMTLNAWHHISLVRHGTALNLYVDGVSVISQTLPGGYTFWADASSLVTVGASSQTGGEVWNGDLDEFHMAATAVWTSNFTPPSSPYTP
jgi:hypothetical protein